MSAIAEPGLIRSYYSAVVHEGLWSSERMLKRYTDWMFDGVPLAGRRVLDIGGGAGAFSTYAAVYGATVTLIDPEADGSHGGIYDDFERLAYAVGVRERVTHKRATFQELDEPPGAFDVILLHNSINHLSEPDVVNLHRPGPEGDKAREVYKALLGKLARLIPAGGHLVVADCARTHFWPMVGMRNPFQSQIEWEKHQNPRRWAKMLAAVGFTDPRIGWSSFNRFRLPGWLLMRNAVGAFFTTGHFRLHMRRGQ